MEDYSDYIPIQEIGRGSYGVVFKCKHKTTGQIVAVKQLKDDSSSEQLRKTALREAKILRQLQHPNVVRLLELFRSKTNLYMVFEFMDRSILKLVEDNPRGLPPIEVKKVLWQLVLGLNFLHGQQIIHRDLKPENILTDDGGAVKLADFGFARAHTTTAGQNLSPYVATRWYRAPELLVGDTYGPAVDVWALGCLLVELATGQPIFPGRTNADQLWLILRCVGCTPRQISRMRMVSTLAGIEMPNEDDMITIEKRYGYFDKSALSLIKSCLAPEPKNRPTCVQLLTHEYFSSAQAALQQYTAAAARAALKTPAVQPGTPTGLEDRHPNSSSALPASEPPRLAPAPVQAALASRQAVQQPQQPRAQPVQQQQGQQGQDDDARSGDSNLDAPVENNSDGEYEKQEAPPMSPKSRERIMRWLDDLPTAVKERAQRIADATMPSSTAPASTGAHAPPPPAATNIVPPSYQGLFSSQYTTRMQEGSTDGASLRLSIPGAGPASPMVSQSLFGSVTNPPSPVISGSLFGPAGSRATSMNGARPPSARNALLLNPGSLAADPPRLATTPTTSQRPRLPGTLASPMKPSQDGTNAARDLVAAGGDSSFEAMVRQQIESSRQSFNGVARPSIEVRDGRYAYLSQMFATETGPTRSHDSVVSVLDNLRFNSQPPSMVSPGSQQLFSPGEPSPASGPAAAAVPKTTASTPQQPTSALSPLQALMHKQQQRRQGVDANSEAGSSPGLSPGLSPAVQPSPSSQPCLSPASPGALLISPKPPTPSGPQQAAQSPLARLTGLHAAQKRASEGGAAYMGILTQIAQGGLASPSTGGTDN